MNVFQADLENHVLTGHAVCLDFIKLSQETCAVHLDHVLRLIVDVLNEAFEVLDQVAYEILLDLADRLIILLVDHLDLIRELQVCRLQSLFILRLHAFQHILVQVAHVFVFLKGVMQSLDLTIFRFTFLLQGSDLRQFGIKLCLEFVAQFFLLRLHGEFILVEILGVLEVQISEFLRRNELSRLSVLHILHFCEKLVVDGD